MESARRLESPCRWWTRERPRKTECHAPWRGRRLHRCRFVGDIPIGGDAICADNHRFDFPGAHLAGGHVVAENGGGDVVMQQLPRSETRPLQERPGFVGVDMEFASAFDRGANDAKGSAVAEGCECSPALQRVNTPPVRGMSTAPNAPMARQAAMSSSYMRPASATAAC